MVKEIRVYVEGGGDGADTKARIREGFHEFLKTIVELARKKRIKFYPVACGSRNATLDAFRTALRQHPNAFNILLVDAEGPVQSDPRKHLQERDGWDLSHVLDEQCHLMVQMMEAWLIADIAALQRYYGQGFNSNSIPKTANVEHIDKPTLNSSLEAATRMTKKGKYHKIRHGAELLKRVDGATVRSAANHCDRLFATLEQKISD